jgi:hypothetical protein
VERTLLDDVKVTTIFNEKQACVLFPDLKGKPDLNVMFYGVHKEFRELCKDFFLYRWMKAGPFDEGKLKPEI